MMDKCKECFSPLFLFALFLTLLFLSSCGNDDIQLPDKDLEGKIGGNDWSYKSANGFLLSADLRYTIRFISDKETATDPCTLPSPGLAHARAIFKPFIGSYVVASQAIDNNQVQVAFQLSPSRSLIASSGFMEIYDINAQIIYGYLQAVLDDENRIEGAFQIKLCN